MNFKDFLYTQAQHILKRWSRSGIDEFILDYLDKTHSSPREILVVGGYGRVSAFMSREFIEDKITELDVKSEFEPDIVADLSSPVLNELIPMKFDAVILIEVLEHIRDFESATNNLYQLLRPTGIVIGSTPWSAPIHDAPHDYFRYTHFELIELFTNSGFVDVKVESRGNLLDSIVYLGLRGLKSWGWRGKLLFFPFALLSLLMPKPKRYSNLQDACIGYNFVLRKN